METDGGNLQNDFFNHARKDRRAVTVFLLNGKRLTGRIKAFDRFTLLLDGPHGELMLFKHAISSVSMTTEGEAWTQVDDPSARREPDVERSDRPAAHES